MRLLIVFLLLGAAGYFFFGSQFKSDIEFRGGTYKHVANRGGGQLDNHFYTLNGVDMIGSEDFIQVLEFDGNFNMTQVQNALGPLLSRYKLEPITEDGDDRSGRFTQQKLNFYSLGTPITVDGRPHYIIYVGLLQEGESGPDDYETVDQIADLKRAASQF